MRYKLWTMDVTKFATAFAFDVVRIAFKAFNEQQNV